MASAAVLARRLLVAASCVAAFAAHAYDTLPSVTRVVAGTYEACAIAAGGALYCWGQNYFGEVGDGTTQQPRFAPARVIGLDRAAVEVAIGDGHACALFDNGTVRCWGRNEAGDLGDGTYNARSSPGRELALPPIKAIAAGQQFTCALASAGTVYCWGNNVHGTLGNGTTQDSPRPVAIPSLVSGVASISAGGNHACALMQAGTVRCWGQNNTGQLGNDTLADSAVPMDVKGLDAPVSQMSASATATCVVTVDRRLICWGLERGVPAPFSGPVSRAPIQVGETGEFISVRAGGSNVCAVRASGSAACWGDNGFGELGIGASNSLSEVPLTVTSSVAWRDISPGDQTVCGLGVDAVAYCWGIYSGDGMNVMRSAPVPVYLAPSGKAAPQVQDLWWGGTTENGWGLSISQHREALFAGLYVYDAQGRPTWYVMSGGTWNADKTAFQGALYRPHGTPWQQYDASRLSVGAAAGTLELDFTDTHHLTMTAVMDGVTTLKPMTRQNFGGADGATEMWWSGPAQNGWGVALTTQREKGFAIWYTYDESGNPTWFVMSDSTETFISSNSGRRYGGTAYATTGAPWRGTAYAASVLQVHAVGTLAFDFDSAISAGQMTATIGGVTRSYSVLRQPF